MTIKRQQNISKSLDALERATKQELLARAEALDMTIGELMREPAITRRYGVITNEAARRVGARRAYPSPARPRASEANNPKEHHAMNTQQYLRALKKLGLTPASKITAEALGMSLPGIQKIAGEVVKVPGPIERLLAMYIKYGLPKEYRP